MANTKSAAKRARQTGRRTLQNKQALTQVKNLLKTARAAVKSVDKQAAKTEVQKLTSALDRAVKSGRVHRNSANRHKSSLNRQLVALG